MIRFPVARRLLPVALFIHLRPRILQSDSAVENEMIRCRIIVDAEITQALELEFIQMPGHLQRRLDQHNRGTASRYTRSRLPVRLVHSEGCRGKSGALKKECRVKSLSRSAKDEYIARKSRSSPPPE